MWEVDNNNVIHECIINCLHEMYKWAQPSLNFKDYYKKLQNNEPIKMTVAGREHDIYSDMVDIRINAKEGFDVGMENNNFVILNARLTDDLINEGIARELVSKVQNLRKTKDFDVADRIKLYYYGNIKNVIISFEDYIKKETLTEEIIEDNSLTEEFNINDIIVKLDVKKVD